MDDFINAIANQLNRLFPEIPIYDEEVPQNFQTPSFYVYQESSTLNNHLMNRDKRFIRLGIMYSPDENKPINEQCRQVETIILNSFRYIDDIQCNVFELETQMEDKMLSIRFKVRYRVKYVESNMKMVDLEQRGEIKGGEKES